MKNLDLNAYGVSEMSKQEMMAMEGGTIGNILKKIGEALVDAAEAVGEAAEAVWDWAVEHSLPNGQPGVRKTF